MKTIDNYIVDIEVHEAIKILDGLFLTQCSARGNGKSRTIHNYAMAWVKVREQLSSSCFKEKEVNDVAKK